MLRSLRSAHNSSVMSTITRQRSASPMAEQQVRPVKRARLDPSSLMKQYNYVPNYAHGLHLAPMVVS